MGRWEAEQPSEQQNSRHMGLIGHVATQLASGYASIRRGGRPTGTQCALTDKEHVLPVSRVPCGPRRWPGAIPAVIVVKGQNEYSP